MMMALTTAFAHPSFAVDNYMRFSYFPNTQLGAQDNYVRALQTVIKYNRNSNLGNDGIFGSETKSAVESYQADEGLTCDGIVGVNTWNSLYSQLSSVYVGTRHYRFKIRINNTSNTTNTYFFDYAHTMTTVSDTYTWLVYRAAPGSAAGQWYTVSSIMEA